MGKRRCMLRGTPKKGRKKGRCLKWGRPAHSKKSATPRSLKKVARGNDRKAVRKRRCLVRNADGQCEKWARAKAKPAPKKK